MRIRTLRGLCAGLWLIGLAGGSSAAPLGLSPGDLITAIEIDALKLGGNLGDGLFFDVGTGLLDGQGRVNSLQTNPSGTLVQSNTTYTFSAEFLSEVLTGTPPFANTSSILISPGLSPDFVVLEGASVVLFGNFIGNLTISGEINMNNPNPQNLSGIGRVQFTGGATNVLAALGGVGGNANVLLDVTVGDFAPPLANLASDGEVWNSDFSASMTGQLIPLSPSPFVPEPSTAVLFGAGLLGLLAVSRRTRGR
jgi:hypothetical protein